MKRFIKDDIFGMSRDRKSVGSKLADASLNCLEHIVCLALYPDSEDVNHWCGEVYAALHSVNKLKQNNKFPSAKFIFQNTWGASGDMVAEVIRATKEDYGEPTTAKSTSEITTDAESYFRWLAEDLSSAGLVSKSAVYRKLNEFILK